MDSYVVDNLKHLSNTEVVRRLLIKYFIDKGFGESFDRHMYPGLLQDLTAIIPVLGSKVEVEPYVEELDTTLGRATLAWNLFVLGNKRMYLGETFHNNLHNLATQIKTGTIQPDEGIVNTKRQTTPRRVINFITKVLGDSEAGYVNLSSSGQDPKKPGESYASRQGLSGMPQQFFSRNSYGT